MLFGGRSDERHVSVASAQNIARNFTGMLAWFWSPGGAVHDVGIDDLLRHQRAFEVDFEPARPAVWPNLEQALDTMPVDDPLFLLALHGGEGEDGRLQKMLERRGIPFTGSGSKASAAAFDKTRAKEMVKGQLRLAESRVVRDGETVRQMLEKHPRLVLKPVAGGSSRGLYFVNRGEDFQLDPKVPYLAEQFISGREPTVGVADQGQGPCALPVLEITFDAGFNFDYAGKYLGKGTHEICPAQIPDAMREEAQRAALAAHNALGCEGYSRSDFVGAQDGVYFLELNTLPGLTSSSLLPQELHAAGIEFRDFLEAQIKLARERSGSSAKVLD